jgi:ribosome-associated translation inhibitor RaiA
MQHANIPYELQDKLRGYITGKLKRKLEKMFKDETIKVETSLFIPPHEDQHEDKAELTILVSVGTKFFEISEALSSDFGIYCAEKELSDEECEKAYQEAYQEKLEEINREYVIQIEGKIEVRVSNDSKTEIEIYPLKCYGDYCIAGLGINIYIYQIPLDLLDKNKDIIIDTIVKFIESIYDLYESI